VAALDDVVDADGGQRAGEHGEHGDDDLHDPAGQHGGHDGQDAYDEGGDQGGVSHDGGATDSGVSRRSTDHGASARGRSAATMAPMQRGFVFGYGSLAAELACVPGREPRDEGFLADLPGFARGWGVAMDNRRDLSGYKYYTAADGTRPPVFVSFLDVAPVAGSVSVNGLCLPVDADELTRLDRRERNYARCDVSDRIDARGAPVWVYVGTPGARERLRSARRAGSAVIAAAYLRAVRAAFANLGEAESAACAPSLAPGELSVMELTRHEVP
jgi:hypothetical protein